MRRLFRMIAGTSSMTVQEGITHIHTLVLGDSLIKNVEAPDEVYISNKSGGKLKDAIQLVRNAKEEPRRIIP